MADTETAARVAPEAIARLERLRDQLNEDASTLEIQVAVNAADSGLLDQSFGMRQDADALSALLTERVALLGALETLIVDANRLCDRNLGGTYEDDCRRSIVAARALLSGTTPSETTR